MNRDNHYEAAFEAYVRRLGLGVVAVDEARRSYLDDDSIKSPDFLVVGSREARLVVDVKGRKFPGGPAENPRRVWQNWSTRSDIVGLDRWAAKFGSGFNGILAFVYHIAPEFTLAPGTPDAFAFRDQIYLVRGVSVADYRAAMRTRSPRWGTVHLPTSNFREVVKPFSHFLSYPCNTKAENKPQINAENAN